MTRVLYASDDDRARAQRFFVDSPVAEALFAELAAHACALGDVRVTATKSRVAFARRTKFLWVHGAPRDGLWIAMLTNGALSSPTKHLRAAPVGKRISTHVKVSAIDAELKRWIGRAYLDDAADRRTR